MSDDTPHTNTEAKSEEPVKYASFLRRVSASLIDTTLSLLPLYPLGEFFRALAAEKYDKISPALINKFLQSPHLLSEPELMIVTEALAVLLANSLIQMIILGALVIVLWCYYDATPGKMLLRMRIVDVKTGKEPSRWQYIIRFLGYIPSLLFLALGFLWIYYDKKRQGWHDKMAGTAVIILPRKQSDNSAP